MGINIYNECNNIHSFNKSLTHHSNKYISGLQILWILSLYIIDGKSWQELEHAIKKTQTLLI